MTRNNVVGSGRGRAAALRPGIGAWALSLGIACCSAGAAEVTRTLDWGGVAMNAPYPVTGGIPFARGSLPDASRVRLGDGGRELPVQTETLARWPDPSVKWLLLDFAAPAAQTNVVLIDGAYRYRRMGSTIQGTEIKGACPFRVRLHAYAGQSYLKIEHFFYYEGDGDHDFVRALGLKCPLPVGPAKIRCIGSDAILDASGPIAGLHQQTACAYQLWNSDGRSARVAVTGRRFEGVLDVTGPQGGMAVGVRQIWQNAAKRLQVDLPAREASVYLWPPESPPLDFRRHAREWSVGESDEPDDPKATTPDPFTEDNYRLASTGVGKTHYVFASFHDARTPAAELLAQYRLFEHRPLVWAPPQHYADSLGRLAYALTLQAVRHCRRADLEFAESYLYNVHDVCTTHTPAYPEQFTTNFVYVKGAAHRHGAWPGACTYVGARGAVMSIAPVPASQMPVAGRDLGVRKFRFRLLLHEGSWPATVPCALPFPTYEALLASIADYERAWAVGTSDIPTITHRERLQPSVMLRRLYRSGTWQMAGRMKTIGVDRSRPQSWAQWDSDAQIYLAYLRTNGLPRTTKK